MTTQKLSKESEAKILTAINNTVGLVEKGSSPTDAMHKVAQDMSLSANYVKLACIGYNTGAVNYQRQENNRALDKFASVATADAGDVINRIWPSEVETAVEKVASTVVSDEYSRRPIFNKAAAFQRQEKLASFDLTQYYVGEKQSGRQKEDPRITNIKTADTLKRKAASLRREKSQLYDRLLSEMGRLGDYFKSAGSLDFDQARANVEARYSGPGGRLMEFVAVRNHYKSASVKVAAKGSVNWERAPYSIARSCLELGGEYTLANNDFTIANTAAKEAYAAAYGPFQSEAAAPRASILSKQSAGFLTGLAAKSMADKFTESDRTIAKIQSELADPTHENELRAIQTQTMLYDLMHNDEIISGHDPETVLNAYNEIATLSPQAAQQPSLVRPWLRKHLTQGGTETFEAGEMANIEKTLSDTQRSVPTMSQPQPQPQPQKLSNVLNGKSTLSG